jgi:hypothetical protein
LQFKIVSGLMHENDVHQVVFRRLTVLSKNKSFPWHDDSVQEDNRKTKEVHRAEFDRHSGRVLFATTAYESKPLGFPSAPVTALGGL